MEQELEGVGIAMQDMMESIAGMVLIPCVIVIALGVIVYLLLCWNAHREGKPVAKAQIGPRVFNCANGNCDKLISEDEMVYDEDNKKIYCCYVCAKEDTMLRCWKTGKDTFGSAEVIDRKRAIRLADEGKIT